MPFWPTPTFCSIMTYKSKFQTVFPLFDSFEVWVLLMQLLHEFCCCCCWLLLAWGGMVAFCLASFFLSLWSDSLDTWPAELTSYWFARPILNASANCNTRVNDSSAPSPSAAASRMHSWAEISAILQISWYIFFFLRRIHRDCSDYKSQIGHRDMPVHLIESNRL